MALAKKAGRLIAIGGAEEMDGTCILLARFVKMAGGDGARIAVLSIGADKESTTAQRYVGSFRRIGAGQADSIAIAAREEAEQEEVLSVVEDATGIFFTGGDQLHFTALLGGTPLDTVVHEQFAVGTVLGGSSAGAALMGDAIIVRGEAECNPRLGGTEMGRGLGLLLGILIDTHFSQRGRHGRLVAAIAQNPQVLGIGLDEDTGIVVEGTEFEVLGSGAATVMDASKASYTNLPLLRQGDGLELHGIQMHVLTHGSRFDLRKRSPINADANSSRKRGAGNSGSGRRAGRTTQRESTT